MLYREIIAVCFEILTKHINTMSGQKVESLSVKLMVHIVTTGLYFYSPYGPYGLYRASVAVQGFTLPFYLFCPFWLKNVFPNYLIMVRFSK